MEVDTREKKKGKCWHESDIEARQTLYATNSAAIRGKLFLGNIVYGFLYKSLPSPYVNLLKHRYNNKQLTLLHSVIESAPPNMKISLTVRSSFMYFSVQMLKPMSIRYSVFQPSPKSRKKTTSESNDFFFIRVF